ncbi:unnamed protein product [Rotaria magnacalcarata]
MWYFFTKKRLGMIYKTGRRQSLHYRRRRRFEKISSMKIKYFLNLNDPLCAINWPFKDKIDESQELDDNEQKCHDTANLRAKKENMIDILPPPALPTITPSASLDYEIQLEKLCNNKGKASPICIIDDLVQQPILPINESTKNDIIRVFLPRPLAGLLNSQQGHYTEIRDCFGDSIDLFVFGRLPENVKLEIAMLSVLSEKHDDGVFKLLDVDSGKDVHKLLFGQDVIEKCDTDIYRIKFDNLCVRMQKNGKKYKLIWYRSGEKRFVKARSATIFENRYYLEKAQLAIRFLSNDTVLPIKIKGTFQNQFTFFSNPIEPVPNFIERSLARLRTVNITNEIPNGHIEFNENNECIMKFEIQIPEEFNYKLSLGCKRLEISLINNGKCSSIYRIITDYGPLNPTREIITSTYFSFKFTVHKQSFADLHSNSDVYEAWYSLLPESKNKEIVICDPLDDSDIHKIMKGFGLNRFFVQFRIMHIEKTDDDPIQAITLDASTCRSHEFIDVTENSIVNMKQNSDTTFNTLWYDAQQPPPLIPSPSPDNSDSDINESGLRDPSVMASSLVPWSMQNILSSTDDEQQDYGAMSVESYLRNFTDTSLPLETQIQSLDTNGGPISPVPIIDNAITVVLPTPLIGLATQKPNRPTYLTDCFGSKTIVVHIYGHLPEDVKIEMAMVSTCLKKYYFSLFKIKANDSKIYKYKLLLDKEAIQKIGTNIYKITLNSLCISKTKQDSREINSAAGKKYKLISYPECTEKFVRAKGPRIFTHRYNLEKIQLAIHFLSNNKPLPIRCNGVLENQFIFFTNTIQKKNFNQQATGTVSKISITHTKFNGPIEFDHNNMCLMEFEIQIPEEFHDSLSYKCKWLKMYLMNKGTCSSIYHINTTQGCHNAIQMCIKSTKFSLKFIVHKQTLDDLRQNPDFIRAWYAYHCQPENNSPGISGPLDDKTIHKVIATFGLNRFFVQFRLMHIETTDDNSIPPIDLDASTCNSIEFIDMADNDNTSELNGDSQPEKTALLDTNEQNGMKELPDYSLGLMVYKNTNIEMIQNTN